VCILKLIVVRRTLAFAAGIIILLLFFMSVSFSFSPVIETFRNSIEYQKADRQVLKKYNALQGKFQYALPNDWNTMEEAFSGGEIIYNNYFVSSDQKIRGFVQVWDINKPLSQFLEESKNAAVGVVDFKYYRLKEITINGKQGYVLDYSRKNNQGQYIKSYEIFIKGENNRVYRVSFFVDERNWKQQYLILFNRIARSFVF
jgi:hypothetical protein